MKERNIELGTLLAAPENGARGRLADAARKAICAVADAVVRRRDKDGNRMGWSSATHVPEVVGTPLSGTAVQEAVATVQPIDPMLAHELAWAYDEKLIGSLKTFAAVRDEEWDRLRGIQEEARERNAPVEERIEATYLEKDAAVAREREAARELEPQVQEAHAEAARRAAECGGGYDAAKPYPDDVLNVVVPGDDVAAAALRLPLPASDGESHIHPRLRLFAEAVFGGLLGLSLGLVAGFIEPEALGLHPLVTALMMVIGGGLAVTVSALAGKAGHEAGAQAYSRAPRPVWLVAFGLAMGAFTVLSALEAVVDLRGLLRRAMSEAQTAALSGASGSAVRTGPRIPPDFVALGLFVGVAFVGYAVAHGYHHGRMGAVTARIREYQHSLREAGIADRRKDPAVRTALQAVHAALALLEAQASRMRRAAQAEADGEAAVAALRARLVHVPDDLPLEAKFRIQDRWDQVVRAQAEVDALYAEAKAVVRGAAKSTRVDGPARRSLLATFLGALRPRAGRGRQR